VFGSAASVDDKRKAQRDAAEKRRRSEDLLRDAQLKHQDSGQRSDEQNPSDFRLVPNKA
jgi:hypothetical protein